MNAWRTAAVCLAAFAAPAALAAQGAGKCDINDGSPFQVNSAKIYLNKARTGKPDEQPRHLQNAVHVLTDNPDKINNQVGRNWLLGQALVEYAKRPGAQQMVKRSELGYAQNPDAMIDVYAAADTALSAVDAAKPECKSETEKWRRQLWVPAINAAGNFINDDQLDSAEAALSRANAIWRGSANAPYYAAIIAQKRNKGVDAASYFKQTVAAIPLEQAARDSNMSKIRQQALYNAGVLYQQLADAEQDAAKKKDYQSQAQEEYKAFLAAYPNSAQAASAQANMARMLTTSGDTRVVDSLYAGMLAEPSKYTDIQLFEAGTAMFESKKYEQSAKLFEAGLAKNPSYRDAIYNLANTYMATDQGDKMLDITRRLVAVDPNNPPNWRLHAAAFQKIGNKLAASDPKKKAYTDSLLKNLEREKNTNPKITGVQLQHRGASHTLTGTIQNGGTSAANYTIKFEFLDAQGNVVASKEAPVSVPAGGTQQFRVDVTQAGIVSWRYAPLP